MSLCRILPLVKLSLPGGMQNAKTARIVNRVPGDDDAARRPVGGRDRRRIASRVVGVVNHVVQDAVAGAADRHSVAGAEGDAAVSQDVVSSIQENAGIGDTYGVRGLSSESGSNAIRTGPSIRPAPNTGSANPW